MSTNANSKKIPTIDPTKENEALMDIFMQQLSQSPYQERFHNNKFEKSFIDHDIPLLGDSTLFLPPFVSGPSTTYNQGNLASMSVQCVNGRMDNLWADDCSVTAKSMVAAPANTYGCRSCQ